MANDLQTEKVATAVDRVVLLPCPFCGSLPEISGRMRAGNELCVIQCGNKKCPAMVARTYLDTFQNAAASWNTRVDYQDAESFRWIKENTAIRDFGGQ